MADFFQLSDKLFHIVMQYIDITNSYSSTSLHVVYYDSESEKLFQLSGNLFIDFSRFGLWVSIYNHVIPEI